MFCNNGFNHGLGEEYGVKIEASKFQFKANH